MKLFSAFRNNIYGKFRTNGFLLLKDYKMIL